MGRLSRGHAILISQHAHVCAAYRISVSLDCSVTRMKATPRMHEGLALLGHLFNVLELNLMNTVFVTVGRMKILFRARFTAPGHLSHAAESLPLRLLPDNKPAHYLPLIIALLLLATRLCELYKRYGNQEQRYQKKPALHHAEKTQSHAAQQQQQQQQQQQ